MRNHGTRGRETLRSVAVRAQAPTGQATLSRLGRLAQLGERLPYKQEVGGSIPSPPMATQQALRGSTCHGDALLETIMETTLGGAYVCNGH